MGSAAAGSLALLQRRKSCREESAEQTKLAPLLTEFLNPDRTFRTLPENKRLALWGALSKETRYLKRSSG
jgi:hypothetical protein